MGTGGTFPGGIAARGVKLTTLPTSAEVKNIWIYKSTTQYAFMA
jgi:hypothetical protein